MQEGHWKCGYKIPRITNTMVVVLKNTRKLGSCKNPSALHVTVSVSACLPISTYHSHLYMFNLLKVQIDSILTTWLISPFYSSTSLFENEFLPNSFKNLFSKLEAIIFCSVLTIDPESSVCLLQHFYQAPFYPASL